MDANAVPVTCRIGAEMKFASGARSRRARKSPSMLGSRTTRGG